MRSSECLQNYIPLNNNLQITADGILIRNLCSAVL
uniref:Uncharacterized protein n=1 Tax=Arundo donax TaxID=35708 RepID=A0A0A8YB61_ARUDO